MTWEIYTFGGLVLAAGAIIFVLNKKKKRTPPVIVVPPVIIEEPLALNWADRRPIGMVMLAEWIEPFKAGDRRWKLGGEYQFSREALMTHADECIANMKAVDYQGMIVWNIEGEEFWKPVSYIGDPRVIAPEMEPFVDGFFSKFKGFRTGVCLRPDVFQGMAHYVAEDWFINLDEKVAYASKRWGCTIFYVDSNVGVQLAPGTDNTIGAGQLIPAETFAKLHKKYPNCLFIPEWHDAAYEPHTALYWHKSWGNDMRGVSLIDCGDTQWSDKWLADAVEDGHILMGRVWWAAPELEKIKKAYEIK